MPLSLAHLSELDVPPLELVELAAKAGFASIGLRTSPASPGGVVYPLRTAAEQAEMRKRLADNGMKVARGRDGAADGGAARSPTTSR